MLRVLAGLLVSILAVNAVGPVTCAGWEPTAVERMACCERAEHDCPDQAAADACCAQQEQTHQPGTTTAATTAAPIVLAAVLAPSLDLATPETAARSHEPFTAPQLHAPPGSFERPLRI